MRFSPRGAVVGAAMLAMSMVTPAAGAAVPPPTFRADDFADGQVLSINPPGENGLVNAVQLALFETTGQRPANSTDQRTQYANLLRDYPTLTDGALPQYYNDESFGVRDIARTERPSLTVPVTIYRDGRDIPHVYGGSDSAMAFGAGYAQAEDRLFLMDVLRHFGRGTVSSFLGPSCANEQMDHDQLLLAPYTEQQAQDQIDALPERFGAQGAAAKQMIDSYVDGVNAYIARTRLDPTALPADYTAALQPPLPWKPSDVAYVAALIGGIFGNGGGAEVRNAALLQYLRGQLGQDPGTQAFTDFREQDDPDAPTTLSANFPYEVPGAVDPSKTALPDDASKPLTGGPTATTKGCDLIPANPTAAKIARSLLALPDHMSNALVVDAAHSADGHPVAVFGPQVSYFAPGILMQEDLHSPDYAAEGVSFPGTGVVEIGRGQDYAWSATSAGSDLTDQRLELICDPNGGTPDPRGTFYEFDGQCLPMTHETFSETALPKPGGLGAPTVIDHQIFRTRHGVVQGWTTARDGRPVAVVNERSTFEHEVDSVVGFVHWGRPALTHDAASWMAGAEQISYTFNWFYADDRDIGYYSSGRLPVRASGVDPDLPTWGTGDAEWQGFLADDAHPHAVNPPSGFLTNWNNKPAPRFAASDAQLGYGPVFRSQLLDAALGDQLAAHGGKITRSELVQAMETAATQDLDGRAVLPELLGYLDGRSEPAGVQAMLAELRSWSDDGAHRRKAAAGDAQYDHHAAVAIMDVLQEKVIRALFDPILAAGGIGGESSTGGAVSRSYTALPMQWVNAPNGGGQHLGSSYDGGYEGYVRKALRQLRGEAVAQPFGSAITSKICGAGPSSCPAALDAALASTFDALAAANGGSTDVASWTATPDTVADGQSLPDFDAIHFRSIGIVGQDPLDWQNRPTFQQVVEFPRHRAR